MGKALISLLWRALVSVAAAIGAAILARTYGKARGDIAARVSVRTIREPSAREGREGREEEAGAGPLALRDQPPPGWVRARPEKTPRPTYWPVVLALGVAFLFWGLVNDIFIIGLGVIFFLMGAAGWIGELRHELDV